MINFYTSPKLLKLGISYCSKCNKLTNIEEENCKYCKQKLSI